MVFRYPGGKTKLLKQIEHYLNVTENNVYYEPFVGGGSVLTHVAKHHPNIKLVVNDLDTYIYSFWKLFELDDDKLFNELYKLISVNPTVELFKKLRNTPPQSMVEKAYYAIFFNRTTFSGIFRSGPIGGYEQKSKWKIDCRYNSANLIKKIILMRTLLRNRLYVYNESFELFFNRIPMENSFIYLDPPYYVKGSMLYNEHMKHKEHELLSQLLSKRKRWVLSYDNCSAIQKMYDFANLIDLSVKYSIEGQKKSLKKMTEYIILPKT